MPPRSTPARFRRREPMPFSDKRITARRLPFRPAPASWAKLKGAQTSMLCDGQGRRGAFDAGLRPVTQAVAFAGPALTIQCRPGDNAAALAGIEWVQEGDVVVLAQGGAMTAAMIGGNYAAMVKARGAVAIVCDGPARDLDELDALGIPVFARGVMPGGPFKTGPGLIGFPVAVGPVTVAPGDIVVGDRDGLVVVRHEEIALSVAGYEAVCAREAGMGDTNRTGTIPPWLRDSLDKIGIDIVD